MLAVPVDNARPGLKSSKLFGNAPMFAIYSPAIKQFFVVENGGVGDGMNTARFLKEQGVDSVAYTHLGEGLYNALESDGIDVYYLGKEPLFIYQVIDGVKEGRFVKVEQNNASTYLDPGMPSGSCECGASHD
jgi:predicted Fe-Mo cluster-binding NifX family protein